MIAKIKKIIPYLLLSIALVGFFGYEKKADAANPDELGLCVTTSVIGTKETKSSTQKARKNCLIQSYTDEVGTWKTEFFPNNSAPTGTPGPGTPITTTTKAPASGNLAQQIEDGCWSVITSSTEGCLKWMVYKFMFAIPSGLLYLSANIFNILINLTLQGSLYLQDFIGSSWAVVRDISNIFFILILLYVAIKTVLNMGGHETKSTIASVIIMAVLINFSLFFTKIVIDSSNIVALIFYNRMDTVTKGDNGKNINYTPATSKKEKDLAGALYKNFDVMKLMNEEFINSLRLTEAVDASGNLIKVDSESLPFFATVTIVIVTGIIMLVAAYTFFTSGIYFLGRIMELWILMIFSPFAFMSFALPQLAGQEYIGWNSWFKKLISSAFSAPIFMFFLYIIFLLLKTPLNTLIGTNNNTMGKMIAIFFPAMLTVGLLLKAKSLAKEGGGQFGELAMSGVKLAGLAAGLAVAAPLAATGRLAGLIASAASRKAGAYDSAIEKRKEWFHGGMVGDAPALPDTNAAVLYVGRKVNKAQKEIGDVEHGRHTMDDLNKEIGREGASDTQMTWKNLQDREKKFFEKNLGEIERDLRNGRDKKGKTDDLGLKTGGIVNVNGNFVDEEVYGEDAYKRIRRPLIEGDIKDTYRGNETIVSANGELTREGTRMAAERLSKEFNELLKSMSTKIALNKYEHLKTEARQKPSVVTQLAAKAPSASWDIRKMADVKVNKKESFGTKATIGLTAAVALAIRSGFKGLGISAGTAQGNLKKDIGETIAEALKILKVNVPSGGEGDHGGEKKDDHGGGHGGGH